MDDIHLPLLRHGRSQADDEDRHEGRYDAPLTDVGRAQAARLAAQWVTSRVRFDSVTSSTLRRAESARGGGAARWAGAATSGP